MSRALKLLLPLVALVAAAVYLAGSFAGASENDPPPREPVVLPSDSTSSAPGSPSTGSSPSSDPSGVPVVTPGPVDDDDDDDDDRHDRDDDD